MGRRPNFEDRYRSGDIPWDLGRPDHNLSETVRKNKIKSCRALDIGCGTGDNSLWLADKGFKVTGIDISEKAIRLAREKASRRKINCRFMVKDFLELKFKSAPFGFVFDRGCFHCFSFARDRRKFAENVASHLKREGLWLSLIGNADEKREGEGPPQHAAIDVVKAVEPYFEILSLRSGYFGFKRNDPPRAWICLMKKRGV